MTVSRREAADAELLFARFLAGTRNLFYLHADPEGTILSCNEAWGDLLCVPASSLPGTPLWRHLLEADSERLRRRLLARDRHRMPDRFLLNVCDSLGAPHTLECLLDVRPDGFVLLGEPPQPESRRLHQELIALTSELAVVARERARALARAQQAEQERERLLESERRARIEAELANRAKDGFLGMVSHDLRTPLASILHWAELLRTGCLDEAQSRRAGEMILRNVRTQMKLVDDLLDTTRIAAGTLRVRLEEVAPLAVVDAALEAVRPSAEQKDISLTKSVESEPGLVQADPGRLEQALVNLLANAIRFTGEGGRVQVSVGRDGSGVVFRVIDTGAGIDRELLPHLFEPFVQGEHARHQRSGLGLGLAIARQIVKLHGGTIEAHSAGPGQGSTFTIRLPAAGRS